MEFGRYPEDLKGNQHLSELKIKKLRVLDEVMMRLQKYLVDWQYWVEAAIEHKREMRAQY